ncbi:MAG: GntR family transcriptional regulator [bacterium]|nr:GntR family transcriptional regulator [bacterium]
MEKENNYLLLDKTKLRKLSRKDISIALPELKNIFDSKSNVIANWLISWIEQDFSCGKIKETDLLPKKEELAYLLGVSVGTIQNALRNIEDKGYVESKQRIGTMVRNWKCKTSNIRKLTSKKDICVNAIKQYIISNSLPIGYKMPSSRVLSGLIGISPNTTRLALETLCLQNILEHDKTNPKEFYLTIKNNDFSLEESSSTSIENITLVQKITKDLEKYISKNLKIGDKFPAHEELSKEFKVSIKTIHDAQKALIKKGIIIAHRGRYGTTVIKMPNSINLQKKEDLIFAPAKDAAFYCYEKTQNQLKNIIANDYPIGSKLPSIDALSKLMDLSPNTVRKALNNLAEEGYLRFERGRYGGTFVIDTPDTSAQTFKWLAVNPKYVEVYQ